MTTCRAKGLAFGYCLEPNGQSHIGNNAKVTQSVEARQIMPRGLSGEGFERTASRKVARLGLIGWTYFGATSITSPSSSFATSRKNFSNFRRPSLPTLLPSSSSASTDGVC